MDKQTGERSHQKECFPMSVLIDILKQKSGRDDLNEDNLGEYIEEQYFDAIFVEGTSEGLKEIFRNTEGYAEYAAKKQIGENAQAEGIDLAKVEELLIGPAEVGKLEEEKKGFGG